LCKMPCGLTAKRSGAVTPCCKYQVTDNLQCLGPTTRTPGYYSILSGTKKPLISHRFFKNLLIGYVPFKEEALPTIT
jgi:hypothetical protein